MIHIKDKNNVVADALSRMRLTEDDFSEEAFAGEVVANDFPKECPLSHKEIAHEQSQDEKLQSNLIDPKVMETYGKKMR